MSLILYLLISGSSAVNEFLKNDFKQLSRSAINLHWLPIAAHKIQDISVCLENHHWLSLHPFTLNSLLQTYVPSRSLRSASEHRFSVDFYINCPTQSEQLSLYPSSRISWKHISPIITWPSNSNTLYSNSVL